MKVGRKGSMVLMVRDGTGTGLGVAIMAGAFGGFAGAVLSGADIGQAFKAGVIGGLVGAASGFLNFGSGDGKLMERLFKHAFSDVWLTGIQGGDMTDMKAAFMCSVASCLGGDKIKDLKGGTAVFANAILGGTVSVIGGGKFANGAITAAYQMRFNDLMHSSAFSYKRLDMELGNFKYHDLAMMIAGYEGHGSDGTKSTYGFGHAKIGTEKDGSIISLKEAATLLMKDIDSRMEKLSSTNFSVQQKEAIVCYKFNHGDISGNYLVRQLNSKVAPEIAFQQRKVIDPDTKKYHVVPALFSGRRNAEIKLFNTGTHTYSTHSTIDNWH